MKLIVGLGNPGPKFARNRHNVGFLAVEHMAERLGASPWKSKFQGRAAEATIGGEKVVLLEPGTFMNESGRAVQEAARFLKIDDADIIVLHDELDLEPGKVRVKVGGGNAGHNGLRSISAHRSNDYVRVRIGIGHPGAKELVTNWVLGDFAKMDREWLDPLLDAMSDAAIYLARGENERFMSEVARLTNADPPKPPKAAPKPESVAKPVGKHPAGERAGKRMTALAENLKRYLAAKKPSE